MAHAVPLEAHCNSRPRRVHVRRGFGLAQLGDVDPLCDQLPNSTHFVGLLVLEGLGIAGDSITAHVLPGPPGAFGYFFAGPNPGIYASPASADGIICIAAQQYRYSSPTHIFQFAQTGVGASRTLETDGSFAPVPAVLSGQSWAFQAWYRGHPNGGTPVSDFSESRIVTFL